MNGRITSMGYIEDKGLQFRIELVRKPRIIVINYHSKHPEGLLREFFDTFRIFGNPTDVYKENIHDLFKNVIAGQKENRSIEGISVEF